MIIALFSILSIPTAYEIWNEKKGEPLKMKWLSMLVRVVIAVVSTWVVAVFKNDNLLIDLVKSAVMAFAIFFLTFDYLINIILGRKPWYSYLSKSPLDKLISRVPPLLRLVLRLSLFALAVVWFLQ